MEAKLFQKTYKRVIRDAQVILWIAYIFAVAIGMLFNYQKFSEFGINIFNYADIFDFLIAPFADFRILLFTVLSFFLCYLIYL